MDFTRKEFIKLTIVGLGGVALGGCGENVCRSGGSAAVGTNHSTAPHSLSIDAADFTAAAEKTYNIQGASAHPHTIVVTAANFAALKRGESVNITSSTDNMHSHVVTLSCTTA